MQANANLMHDGERTKHSKTKHFFYNMSFSTHLFFAVISYNSLFLCSPAASPAPTDCVHAHAQIAQMYS